MFTLKELNQLKTILNYSDFMNNKSKVSENVKLDDNQSNLIIMESLRGKICDLITLKQAWDKGRRIEEESNYY